MKVSTPLVYTCELVSTGLVHLSNLCRYDCVVTVLTYAVLCAPLKEARLSQLEPPIVEDEEFDVIITSPAEEGEGDGGESEAESEGEGGGRQATDFETAFGVDDEEDASAGEAEDSDQEEEGQGEGESSGDSEEEED